jgi:alpha-1,2-mannosyltransferase
MFDGLISANKKLIVYSDKRPAFFAVRYLLAGLSTVAECAFYRTVVTKVNDRVGRYLYFMMLFNAGMWNASTGKAMDSFLCRSANTIY